MKIRTSKKAAKYLESMDKKTMQRIKAAVEGIPEGDIKALTASPGSYRLRVGSYRIIFSYEDENTILIEKIAPRGEVYKGV